MGTPLGQWNWLWGDEGELCNLITLRSSTSPLKIHVNSLTSVVNTLQYTHDIL